MRLSARAEERALLAARHTSDMRVVSMPTRLILPFNSSLVWTVASLRSLPKLVPSISGK